MQRLLFLFSETMKYNPAFDSLFSRHWESADKAEPVD